MLKELIFDIYSEEFIIWMFWLLFRLPKGSGGTDIPVLEFSIAFFSYALNAFCKNWKLWGVQNLCGFWKCNLRRGLFWILFLISWSLKDSSMKEVSMLIFFTISLAEGSFNIFN